MQKIKEVMMRDVLTEGKQSTIVEMSKQLHEHRIGAVVITDNSNYPIGIVSERDIIRSIVAYGDKALRKQAQDIMSAPVFALSPEDDIESAAMLMQLNNVRRIPIVENDSLVGIISYRDITNALRKNVYMLEEKNEHLEDRANRDPMTKVYNKAYLLDQLNYHIDLAKRSDKPMSVMMIDIDHFKDVNDTYGHLCGDEVLKKLSSIMVEKSRSINIVGRYGGEEFMIIGPIGDYKSSMYLAERLRKIIEKTPFECRNKKFSITISVGVAIWNRDVEKPEDLIEFADRALYAAKNSGRNQVRMSDYDE